MEDKDELLLKDFFKEHRQEIADNGFSRRVMNRLPERRVWLLSNVLSVLTAILAVGLFVVNGGVRLLGETLREVFQSITFDATLPSLSQTEPWAIAVAAVVLLFMGYGKLVNMAE